MKRWHLYALLATPLLLMASYMLIMPSSTRTTFLTEFRHRIATMFGYEPEPVLGADGKQGLRLESPEEYGLPTTEGESANENANELEPEQTSAQTSTEIEP